MVTAFKFYSYLLSLVIPVGIGIRYFRKFQPGLRTIWILMAVTLVSEFVAGLTGLVRGNNMIVYHLYTPISFWLISLYFNYRLSFFKKYHLGYLIGTSGVVAEIVDTLCYHSFEEMDRYAILHTALCGLIMMLLDCANCFLKDKRKMMTDPGLQISLLFGLFWCSSALILGGGVIFSPLQGVRWGSLEYLWTINIFLHLGIGYVFFSLTQSKLY